MLTCVLCGFLSARSIESAGRAVERVERIRVNLLTLVNVDRASRVAAEAELKSLAGSFNEALLKVSFTFGVDSRGPHLLRGERIYISDISRTSGWPSSDVHKLFN